MNANSDDIRIEKNANGVETFVFDPYNPLNVEITVKDVENILKKYGIDLPVTNFNLYKRAFIHKSYLKKSQEENQQNNNFVIG